MRPEHGPDHGHGHDHDHDSGHGHHHDGAEDGGHTHADAENPWAGQGSVMLDIGGDVGALVVVVPEDLTGREIEIRPAGASGGHHPHVAVVLRPAGAEMIPSLVYPELVEGSYELYEKGTDLVVMTASVRGGEVTEETWPVAAPEGAAGAPSADRAGGG